MQPPPPQHQQQTMVTNAGVMQPPSYIAEPYFTAAPRTVESYRHRQSTVIGVLLVIIGCMSIIFNIVDLAVGNSDHWTHYRHDNRVYPYWYRTLSDESNGVSGHGFWCGAMVGIDRLVNIYQWLTLAYLVAEAKGHILPLPSLPLSPTRPFPFTSISLFHPSLSFSQPSPSFLFSLFPAPFPFPSPFLSPARGSGERCKLPSGVQGGASAANAFWTILTPEKTRLVTTDLVNPACILCMDTCMHMHVYICMVLVTIDLVIIHVHVYLHGMPLDTPVVVEVREISGGRGL